MQNNWYFESSADSQELKQRVKLVNSKKMHSKDEGKEDLCESTNRILNTQRNNDNILFELKQKQQQQQGQGEAAEEE